MRSMWRSADIALGAISGSFVDDEHDPRVIEGSPTPRRTQESGSALERARLTTSCQSGSCVASGGSCVGGRNLGAPFGLIFLGCGILLSSPCTMQSLPRA